MLLFFILEDTARAARSAPPAAQCEVLLAEISQGSRDAFEALYRLTAKTIYTYALSLTRNPDDAQDAMMETFLAVRAGADRYHPQGKPLAWMFTIARNAVNQQRRQAGKLVSLEDLTPGQATVPFDPDAALILQHALRILSEAEREVVLLHAASGLRHREIAQALNQPLSTVLSRYARALGKLRKQLSDGKEDCTHENDDQSRA